MSTDLGRFMQGTRRPNLFIVGAGKSGTFALYEWLSNHPDVHMSTRKEPNFFDSDLHFHKARTTEEEYRSLFQSARGEKYLAEASVSYLLSHTAASEIKSYSPDAKIIIMVRNPFDVVQARHAQNLVYGDEDIRDLDEALRAEPQRRAGVCATSAAYRELLFYREWIKFHEQIARYRAVFPERSVFIGLYDDLMNDPKRLYQRILDFLGLDYTYPGDFNRVNARQRVRNVVLQRILRGKFRAFSRMGRTLIPSATVRALVKNWLLRVNTTATDQRGIMASAREQLSPQIASEVATLGPMLCLELDHWLLGLRTDER